MLLFVDSVCTMANLSFHDGAFSRKSLLKKLKKHLFFSPLFFNSWILSEPATSAIQKFRVFVFIIGLSHLLLSETAFSSTLFFQTPEEDGLIGGEHGAFKQCITSRNSLRVNDSPHRTGLPNFARIILHTALLTQFSKGFFPHEDNGAWVPFERPSAGDASLRQWASDSGGQLDVPQGHEIDFPLLPGYARSGYTKPAHIRGLKVRKKRANAGNAVVV